MNPPAAADDAFDREWVAHLIAVALARLAGSHPRYHEALRRFLIDGQSYAEIAAETGRKPGDLKNDIYRGRAKLVAFLRDEVATVDETLRAIGLIR